MTNVLLVDDDTLILQIYSKGLRQRGFEVQTASDGLEAMKNLRAWKPDVVVLDLMMPKFSGSEVLKYIQSQPDLKQLPVVVLSNSYFGDSDSEPEVRGARKALFKVRCTPAILAETITEVLSTTAVGENPAPGTGAPDAAPSHPDLSKPTAPSVQPAPPQATETGGVPSSPKPAAPASTPQVRQSFVESIRTNCAALRELNARLVEARSTPERATRLQELHRKLHFVNTAAGLVGAQKLLSLTSGLQALTLEVSAHPARLTRSVLRTINQALFQASRLADQAQPAAEAGLGPTRALVVTHDLLSMKGAAEALRRANVQMDSCADAAAALQLLSCIPSQLLLFEANLPGTTGVELCAQVRKLTGHWATPVILFTEEADFERLSQSLPSGCELIAKPVFPLELSVQIVTRLLAS